MARHRLGKAKKRNRENEGFVRSWLANVWTYDDYLNHFVNLALSSFEWINIAPSLNERYLERTLLIDGCAILFKDDVIGEWFGLKTTLGGRFNVYGDPIYRRAIGENGYQNDLTNENSIIVWNNYTKTGMYTLLQSYAMRLWELDRAISVNAAAQKTPILIRCDENERLTMENVYAKYDGNQPVIYGTKGLNTENFEVLKTDAPFVAPELYELKKNIYNECLVMLGITNLIVNKKERLINDEVQKSMGGTITSRFSRLYMRREACQRFNEMFPDYVEKYGALDVRFRDSENTLAEENLIPSDESPSVSLLSKY